jgi:hypothetical protein
MEGVLRRLNKAIEIAVMRNDFDLLRTLVIVRDSNLSEFPTSCFFFQFSV